MIELNKFSEHDIDGDPVVFLSCGHFFAISTMDGHFGDTDTEKAKTCPECRSPIDRIFRYGRAIRLIGLRALERKHLASVQKALDSIMDSMNVDRALGKTKDILKEILSSPMTKIYEASRGSESGLEVPTPPSGPLIRCLEMRGKLYTSKMSRQTSSSADEQTGDASKKKKVFDKAETCFLRAARIAEGTHSRRSLATVRLGLVRLYLQYFVYGDELKSKALPLLDKVSNSGFNELQDVVEKLREQVEGKEIVQVLEAMGGFNLNRYGAGASDHWYECPNGHPYFIGECGGAMQAARCIECRAPVGGGDHQLNPTNRAVGGVFREVMNSAGRS